MKAALWGIGDHAKKNLIPALHKVKNIDFVGVFTRNKEILSDVASSFDCKTWNSAEQMLSDKGLDTIFLSTPPGLHYHQGLQIIHSGKNLICEKPITTNFIETKHLLDEARRRKLLVFEAYMFLYHAHFSGINEFIRKNKDNLKLIELIFELPKLSSPGYRFSDKLGGSCLYDVGSYTVLALLELFKKDKISLKSSNLKYDNDSNIDISGTANFIINDQINCYLKWSYNSEYANKIKIKTHNKEFFSEKIFSKDENYVPSINLKNKNDDIVLERLESGNHFVSMLESFADCSTSIKKRNLELKRIESLASILSKIKGMS